MGFTFEKCAYYDGQPACATRVDEHGIAIDYGYCGPNCPTLGMKNQHIQRSAERLVRGCEKVLPALA